MELVPYHYWNHSRRYPAEVLSAPLVVDCYFPYPRLLMAVSALVVVPRGALCYSRFRRLWAGMLVSGVAFPVHSVLSKMKNNPLHLHLPNKSVLQAHHFRI